MQPIELETPRLRLRGWHDRDLDPLAEMCADPRVMRYFPATLSRDECAAAMARCRVHFIRHGFGFWVVEHKDAARFIGLAGLAWSRLDLPFCPAVEIGWRLVADQWGQGLAYEAAQAALAFAFEQRQLDEVVSYTSPLNERSWRLMGRLGMQADEAASFDHPRLPEGHPLRRHLLYRMSRDQWDDRRR